MKRLIISISVIFLLAFFSLMPAFAAENRDASVDHYNRGYSYLGKGLYDQAILEFTKAIEINPRFAEAYYNRGLTYAKKGEYDRAISDWTKAIEINPKDAIAYSNRGAAYGAKGQYDRAISDCNKAIEINPRFAKAYNNRGNAYDDKGEYERAISDFNKAIEINPRFAVAYSNRGLARNNKGEYDQAISDCTKAIEINPRFAEAYSNRGLAHKNKGEYDRAISDYNKAIEINPRYAKAYNNRGNAYKAKAQYDRAISDFTKAIEINLGDAMAYYNRGNAYKAKGQYELAISDYTKAIEINPGFAEAYNNRAVAYYSKGEYDKGWDDVDKAQSLGYQVPPEFLKLLREASGRKKSVIADTEGRISRLQARPERPQRRATTFARSAAQPYQIDDEEGYVPARPRPNEQKKTKTLHDAARDGDIDQVQLLISKGANVNEQNRMGWTPLHTAVQNRRQALIEPLIAKGADINATNNRGQTPLMAAVYIGQKDAVELLIAKGADVNIMAGGDNALSLAQKRRNTEIVNLLLKHGAEEPSLQDLMGDRYYGEQGGASPYPAYEEQTIQRRTGIFRGTSPTVQSPVQVDILADPNEIRARLKTFEGLEKALEGVDANSQNEIRQWQQKRYDNRTLLIRTVQRQFEDEIGVIRKVAVEEKAKKTTETIDSLLTGKQERFKKVSKELLTQKRELRQSQPTRGRGRARTSVRSTRGRTSQRGQPYGDDMTDPLYGRGGGVMPGTSRYQSTRPVEQVDVETENEIRQWLQASVEDKTNLAQAVHEQLRVEISSIRIVAVEEEAKKTTAAIDGVLLYRQTRFEALISKMEEEQQALRQQTQDPRIRGRGRYPQDGQMQQQNQPRTRGRRR